MSSPQKLREDISKELEVTKKEITIDISSSAYPSISLRFLVDSKADVDLEAKKLVAYVNMATVTMGKITWDRTEDLKVNSFYDISVKGSGWVILHFTPPFSAFKSEFATNWNLKGILVFSSNIGDITKHFSVDFRAKKDEIKRVLEKYPNLA